MHNKTQNLNIFFFLSKERVKIQINIREYKNKIEN